MGFPTGYTPWYKKPSGIIMIGLGVLVLGLLFGFLSLVGNYWWNIRAGRGDLIREQAYAGFTKINEVNHRAGSISRTELETNDDPYQGAVNAKVVVVEYVDFQCPNCLAAEPILQKILSQYGQKVKLIVRDFPVDSLHPKSSELSYLAYCAKEQNVYWPVHNWLFADQNKFVNGLTSEIINEAVQLFSLKREVLQSCLNSNRPKVEVNKDYADGYGAGVGGTPTFFVNGEKVEGVVPFEIWDGYLKEVN